jgi:NAD(P)-dependent dehydrogenase (short-subunit alcohol dehydrogenase family)
VIGEARARFGRIDTLVNNAGIFNANLHPIHRGRFAGAHNVNLAGFFRITQLAIAEMEKQGSASRAGHHQPGRPRHRFALRLASLTKGGLKPPPSLAIGHASAASA